jgi:hypothetical protein
VVGISGNLCGVTGNAAQQVHSVAATTDDCVTLGSLSPAGSTGDGGVIMGIFRLHEENFTNFALLDQANGIVKGGGVTADLTDHQFFAGLFLCLDHRTAVVHRQRHRLFAQYVLAGHQGIYGGLTVCLVVGNNDHTLNIVTSQQIVIVCVVIQMTNIVLLIVLMQTGLVKISQRNQLCIFTLQSTCNVNSRERANANHTKSNFSCHSNSPPKYV